MARLFGFDYKSPFFYMVTLKRLKGLADFSHLGPTGLIENEITKVFVAIIKRFHVKWRCLDEISPFVVMPDHIHLLIKIRDIPDRVALGVLVSQLAKALRNAYWQVVAADAATRKTPFPNPTAKGLAGCASAQPSAQPPPPIFEPEWHDWIVKKRGQLAAFRRYIRENPSRAWLRRENARYFQSVQEVEFLGQHWFGYGNLEILNLPVLHAFKGHRTTALESTEAKTLLAEASRIGPGGAGVSTFMSPLEKACGNAIAKAGGAYVVLSPEGFGPRWHPPREKERFCAKGRMLFLSLYPADTKKPDKATLYTRCHKMVDLANEALPSSEA